MADTDGRQDHDLQTSGEKSEERKREKTGTDERSSEFAKGTLFGILISAICAMGLFLIFNGTIKKDRMAPEESSSGAAVLTSQTLYDKLEQIQNRISTSFLYEVDETLLTKYLMKGLMVGLNDPYANYYTVEELEQIRQISEGEYLGIGVVLLEDKDNQEFRIASVYANSPAEAAGISGGDIVLEVDHTSVSGMDLSSISTMIKTADQSVELTLQRKEEVLTVEVTVSDVQVQTVEGKLLENKTGYVKINEFDEITVRQFQETMAELQAEGMESLIVDLRDNPGGVLDAVCSILDELLPEGMLVYTENREGVREEHRSDASRCFTGAMVVLVNGNSASASEIFAGAIQDFEAGTVIGTQTYGKGVVQRTYLLDDGSAVKLTTDKYYTPKGRNIDGIGITPDIVVDEAAEETTDTLDTTDAWLSAALELLE